MPHTYLLIFELKSKGWETFTHKQKDLEEGHSMKRGKQVQRPQRENKYEFDMNGLRFNGLGPKMNQVKA